MGAQKTPMACVQVGVRFDAPFPGGVNLGGQCGEGQGAICMTSCLQAGEGTSSTGPEGSHEELPSALDIVFDTAIQACITKPTILLLKVKKPCPPLLAHLLLCIRAV